MTHRSNVRSQLGAIVADAVPGSLPDWCRLPPFDEDSDPRRRSKPNARFLRALMVSVFVGVVGVAGFFGGFFPLPGRPGNIVLPTGTKARIIGLASASAAHYNNSWGAIKSFDEESGRYLLQVDAAGKQLKLKRDNVVL